MTVDAILDRLEAKRTRRGWSARCPAHRDRSPSLSIAEGTGGRLLLHCHAGCSYDEIRQALGLESSHRRDEHHPVDVHTEALRIARTQPWARNRNLSRYATADAIRRYRRRADQLRRSVTLAGDTDRAWDLATLAADLDLEATMLEEASA